MANQKLRWVFWALGLILLAESFQAISKYFNTYYFHAGRMVFTALVFILLGWQGGFSKIVSLIIGIVAIGLGVLMFFVVWN